MRYFCLLIMLLFSRQIIAQTTAQLLDEANHLREQKKYDEALTLCNKILAKDSLHYHAYLQRGTVYLEMTEMQKAYDDYTRAIGIYPDSARGYLFRGVLFYSIISTEEAIQDYTTGIALADDDLMRMMFFTNRGNARAQKRDFNGAYEDYSKAWLLDTLSKPNLNNMAITLNELGRKEEAIEYLKKTILLDSGFVFPYVNIGFQYTQLGKYKEAIEYFDKALSIENDEPRSLNNRGLARFYLNDYSGALKDINKSISIYPENAYAYKNRALVYIAQMKFDLACTDLQKALDLEFTKVYGPEVAELKQKYCAGK